VGGVLGDPASERFAGERLAAADPERRLGGQTATFGEPHTQDDRSTNGTPTVGEK